MVLGKEKVFNLADTNGRRKDVLNALKIYLENLTEIREEYPSETWNRYPNSIAQFVFYEKTLEKSKDYFKKHDSYDAFSKNIQDCRQQFLNKESEWVSKYFPLYKNELDKNIEARSRHYINNLEKIGFLTKDIEITEAGHAYLTGSIFKDDLEKLLPLDNINMILLRQLLKVKVFSININGKRKYYSPFNMAMALLIKNNTVDIKSFETIVQGLNPYIDENVKEDICDNRISIDRLCSVVENLRFEIPAILKTQDIIEESVFKTEFKSSKNNASTQRKYYAFYIALSNYRNCPNKENYNKLVECFDKNSSVLNKAFGYGKAVFEMGNKGNRYTLEKFKDKNNTHPLLSEKCLNEAFCLAYKKSKHLDKTNEYSDTTIRLLSATGLFKFKNLAELSYKDILSMFFDDDRICKNIFGEMTEEEYLDYEVGDSSFFGKNVSLVDIFNFTSLEVSTTIEKIESFLGVRDKEDISILLDKQKNEDFISHINAKYPKEKIMKLLPLFSDRTKDRQIKEEVNDAASVPTIYEYIIGIAWYYISNKEFDLYNSLNLTLNADFEPVIHAGGGDGDIVIHYEDIIVMLEVTLMNKQAQKRGEWEPVLRHSLNLKAANEPTETITFFIADELDYNTINIWRAVASVSLESTNTHTKVDGVVIMPFTNNEVLAFLKNSVYYKDIVKAVKDSFAKVPQITDVKWQDEVIYSLLS